MGGTDDGMGEDMGQGMAPFADEVEVTGDSLEDSSSDSDSR